VQADCLPDPRDVFAFLKVLPASAPVPSRLISQCAHRTAAAHVHQRTDGRCMAARQENDIGQEHALFYEAHATYLELRGSYAKATAAFEAGLGRSDAPVACSCLGCSQDGLWRW